MVERIEATNGKTRWKAEAEQHLVDRLTEKTLDRTAEIFAQWAEEDATDDPEELAQHQAEWEELKANINVSRAITGEELVDS